MTEQILDDSDRFRSRQRLNGQLLAFALRQPRCHAAGPIHACTTLEENGPTLSIIAASSGLVRVTLA
jgi:hypothetical protein